MPYVDHRYEALSRCADGQHTETTAQAYFLIERDCFFTVTILKSYLRPKSRF